MDKNIFSNKFLIKKIYPSRKQQEKELWDVKGILKNRSNKEFKFDVRPLTTKNNIFFKKISTASKADKIVIEQLDAWYIIEAKELHQYIIEHKLKKIDLLLILKKLEWNITLTKQK
jgi:hypothetical protein|tara:strand:+ start:1746 stop:2093 length:348 start_codon:yes stop_codon:yes gene_type:complete